MSYEVMDDQIQTGPGAHTLTLQAVGEGTSDCFDFDAIAIGYNWSPPARVAIFEDDFEGHTALYDQIGDPWTVISGSSDPIQGDQTDLGTWRLWSTTGDELNGENPALPGMAGNYAITDSDLSGDGVLVNEELISPPINTANWNKLRLNFNWNYRIYEDLDHAQVAEVDFRVKDNDPDPWGDWINLKHLEQTDVDPLQVPPEISGTDVHDLSVYDGKILQIRFHFYDAEFDYWFAVDTIRVSGIQPEIRAGIIGLSLVGDQLTLDWEPDGTYYIEHTSDLTGTWADIAGPITGTTADVTIPAGAEGYYRLRGAQ